PRAPVLLAVRLLAGGTGPHAALPVAGVGSRVLTGRAHGARRRLEADGGAVGRQRAADRLGRLDDGQAVGKGASRACIYAGDDVEELFQGRLHRRGDAAVSEHTGAEGPVARKVLVGDHVLTLDRPAAV